MTQRLFCARHTVIAANCIVCAGKALYNSMAAKTRRDNNASAAFSVNGE